MKGHKSEHHKRARGGDVEPDEDKWGKESQGSKKTPNEEGDTPEKKEAEEKKRGGACMPKRKHGGHVKEEHRVEGKLAKMHMGRPGRARGGRTGADKSPLSSAAHVAQPVGHSTND
jgi:hypothetical protein